MKSLRTAARAAMLVGKPGSATAQIEARAHQMVAAGEASDINAAIGLVVASDPELYNKSVGEKDAIRPEYEAKIDAMLERLEPHPKDELLRLADEMYLKGEAQTSGEAKYLAIQKRPDLYQAMRTFQDDYMKKSNALSGEKVKASAHGQGTVFEAKARNLVTAGDAANIDEAFGLVAASDPEAYSDYLATLH